MEIDLEEEYQEAIAEFERAHGSQILAEKGEEIEALLQTIMSRE
jgi:hypothetical protein